MKLLETLLKLDIKWPDDQGEFACWNQWAGSEGMVITLDYRPSDPALDEHTRNALGGWDCDVPDNHATAVVTRSQWLEARYGRERGDEWAKGQAEKFPAYWRKIPDNWRYIDTYRINELFPVDDNSGAILHARKKLILAGVRTGGKSLDKDLREAVSTLECKLNK